MIEVKKKVCPIAVFAYCEKCKVSLEYNGVTLTSYPALYPHSCPMCGHTENLDHIYPIITYEFHNDHNSHNNWHIKNLLRRHLWKLINLMQRINQT
jgi:hypothetical protein